MSTLPSRFSERIIISPWMDAKPTHNGELMLYGSKPPYKLHITIGDPDAGDAMQFEKAN